MTRALLVTSTGNLYRMVSDDLFEVNSIKDGMYVRCYHAQLKARGNQRGIRQYDRVVEFLFDSSKHRLVDTREDFVQDQELHRARELVCRKFHPEKLKPPYLELANRPHTGTNRGSRNPMGDMLKASKTCLDYLLHPGRFDQTKVSILKYDLQNAISSFEQEIKKENGEKGHEAGRQITGEVQRV